MMELPALTLKTPKVTTTDRRDGIVRTVNNNVSLSTRVAEVAAHKITEGTMGTLPKTIYRHKVGIHLLHKDNQCRCPLPNKTTQEINHSQTCLNLFLGLDKDMELRCHKPITPSYSQLTRLLLNSTA